MDADPIQLETCALPHSSTAPALARGFVSSTLASWSAGNAYADVPLIASELVSNAVRHAHGDLSLSLRRERDRVRIAVSDDSEASPVKRDLATARNGGWGMHIVERLSTRWGLEMHSRGKTVWCEIDDGASTGGAG